MPIICTDNGPQVISHIFEEFCEEQKIVHERNPTKTPNMNAHIESFYRILEDGYLSQWEFKNYQETYQAVYQFIEFDNNRRIHSSLKYLAPKAFMKKLKTTYQNESNSGMIHSKDFCIATAKLLAID